MVTYSELDSSNTAVLAVIDRSASPVTLCRVYLSLDLDRDEPTLSWGTDYACETGYPIRVGAGREIRWSIPGAPTAFAANEFAASILPLCERIAAGWSLEWDGNNQRGQFTADARAAELEIDIATSNPDSCGDGLAYVDADDYLLEDPGENATVDGVIETAADDGSVLDAGQVEAALERFAAKRSAKATNTYYVVCDANGPISVRLKATTEREALAEFEELDGHAAVDGCRTDAEDDLIDDTVDCHSMDVFQFGAALERAGATHVLHLDHDWSLWVVTPD